MPQVATWKVTPEQLKGHIDEALELLAAHELTPDERARLLPVLVDQLSEKPLQLPDAPPLPAAILAGVPGH